MRTFPTIWAIAITRIEADRFGCGFLCGGGKTLGETIAMAYHWATFYCGERGAAVVLTEECAACKGSGERVVRLRPRKVARCKSCRGAPEVQRIVFVAEPHYECDVYRLGEKIFTHREREEQNAPLPLALNPVTPRERAAS